MKMCCWMTLETRESDRETKSEWERLEHGRETQDILLGSHVVPCGREMGFKWNHLLYFHGAKKGKSIFIRTSPLGSLSHVLLTVLPSGNDEIGALNGKLNAHERKCRRSRCIQNNAPRVHLQRFSLCLSCCLSIHFSLCRFCCWANECTHLYGKIMIRARFEIKNVKRHLQPTRTPHTG